MRSVTPLLITAILAGCSATPPREAAIAQANSQARLAKLLAGKVAGAPQSCLPNYRANDMITIDDQTIVFRDGTSRVWVQRPQTPCNLLSAGPYALVTKQTSGLGLCRGDIAQVADTLNHTTVGTCVMSDFVPYTRPGA
jgi:hypothetical protein